MGLEDMTGTMRRVLGVLTMTMAVLPFVAYQGVAQAADPTVTVDIGAGENATKVGTTTFTLSTTTLTIDTVLLTGVTLAEPAKACIDDAPFSSRIAPGQCQFTGDLNGDFSIALATVLPALTGTQVCAQVHYTVNDSRAGGGSGQTAYAGHQNTGPNFFGNVCLERPTTPPPGDGGGGGGTTSAPVSSPATASSSAPASVEGTSEAAETDVAVEGTKSGGSGGELAATGGGMSLGTSLALGFGLLLAGAAMITLPRHLVPARGAHRRRH